MVEYLLLDGVSEGNTARIMGWSICRVEQLRKRLGEFRTRDIADRRRARDRMYRRAFRHQKRFGIKETA